MPLTTERQPQYGPASLPAGINAFADIFEKRKRQAEVQDYMNRARQQPGATIQYSVDPTTGRIIPMIREQVPTAQEQQAKQLFDQIYGQRTPEQMGQAFQGQITPQGYTISPRKQALPREVILQAQQEATKRVGPYDKRKHGKPERWRQMIEDEYQRIISAQSAVMRGASGGLGQAAAPTTPEQPKGPGFGKRLVGELEKTSPEISGLAKSMVPLVEQSKGEFAKTDSRLVQMAIGNPTLANMLAPYFVSRGLWDYVSAGLKALKPQNGVEETSAMGGAMQKKIGDVINAPNGKTYKVIGFKEDGEPLVALQ